MPRTARKGAVTKHTSENESVSARIIAETERYCAHNYAPKPVVVTWAEGARVRDADGREYFDMLSAYSALNFGHRHPEIVAAAKEQLDRVTLTSRAFHNGLLGEFCKALCALTGKGMALPMNTGAEAVETALKTARRWGAFVKGVPDGRQRIVCCAGNFHGRPDTVAFLFEPIQGEAGVILPPEGYIAAVRELCTRRGILMIADEVQTGFARTGDMFACDHEGVVPDIYILGKALGGGIMPVSAVCADEDILGVYEPGSHGSTFGGNPLACAVALKAMEIVRRDDYTGMAREKGERLRRALAAIDNDDIVEIRGRGLLIGVEFKVPAAPYVAALIKNGVLAKETHERTIRFAPPLNISIEELDEAAERIARAFAK